MFLRQNTLLFYKLFIFAYYLYFKRLPENVFAENHILNIQYFKINVDRNYKIHA